jgi:hypothetical protein
MRVSPFLLSARKPLLASLIASFAIGLIGILLVSTHRLWDLGVLWHTASQRRATPADLHVLLASLFVMEALTAIILAGGVSLGAGLGADRARAIFLLTRPRTRSALFLTPLLLASAALLLIPAATALLLIGWLALVHAPVLYHLIAIARLVPSVSPLGMHPGLLPLLGSLHLGTRYLAGFAFGIAVVAIVHTRRWLLFSPNPTVKRLVLASTLLYYLLPAMIAFAKPVAFALLLKPGAFALPSALNIALHLGFAAALCLFTLRFMQRIEM